MAGNSFLDLHLWINTVVARTKKKERLPNHLLTTFGQSRCRSNNLVYIVQFSIVC